MRDDAEENKRGILIVTTSTKTTLSFVASHHSHSSSFFLPPAGLVWPTQPTVNINLCAETDNVKRKIGIPSNFFLGIRQKDGEYQVNPDSELKMTYKPQ